MNRLNIIIIVINICLIEAIIIFNGLRISFENTGLSQKSLNAILNNAEETYKINQEIQQIKKEHNLIDF